MLRAHNLPFEIGEVMMVPGILPVSLRIMESGLNIQLQTEAFLFAWAFTLHAAVWVSETSAIVVLSAID